jgi:hypothetical protein
MGTSFATSGPNALPTSWETIKSADSKSDLHLLAATAKQTNNPYESEQVLEHSIEFYGIRETEIQLI